jgi:hypothetical protein
MVWDILFKNFTDFSSLPLIAEIKTKVGFVCVARYYQIPTV